MQYSTQRAPGREHFPAYPKGFIGIRFVQLILALVVLGLCGYGVTYLVFAGDGLSLFTAVATLIVCVYYIVAEFGAPAAHNYWAVLSLDIFLLIFWVISFAILADEVAPAFNGYTECNDYGYCETYSLDSAELVYASCLAAAAGIGGLEFVLFVISLAIVGVKISRHRAAGLHSTPGTIVGQSAPVSGHTAPSNMEKGQMQPQAQSVPYQQGPAVPGFQPQPTPPPQQMYAAPQQQMYASQPSTSPLSTHHTGGSFQQMGPQQQQQSMPMGANGPYETHGQSIAHHPQ